MNRDIITTRRQQPVTSAANRRPISKTTMTTAPAKLDCAQRPAVEAGRRSGANMVSAGGVRKVTAGRSGAQPALMKKAYVRFDDYLDLNEENMRRSCKRLMNHLYSESSSLSTAAAASSSGATTTTCQSSLEENSKPTGAPITNSTMANNSNDDDVGGATTTTTNSNCSSRNSISGGAKSKSSNANSSRTNNCPMTAAVQQKSLQNSTNAATTTTTTTTTSNGKSYLRSQYERRQQRQLELMSKMQLEPGKPANNNADGASECRRQQQQQQRQQQEHQSQKHQQLHQQDLVAKSHELSKRRFFEKLERRESIRNSKLNTPPSLQAQVDKRPQDSDVNSCSLPKTQPHNHKCNQQQGDKQKSSLGNEELLLKVYKSIALKGTNSAPESATCDGSKATLGQLDGAHTTVTSDSYETKELANELTGFCTLSPQLPLADNGQLGWQKSNSSTREHLQEEQLIQLVDRNGMRNSSSSDLMAQSLTKVAADSAFEIKVPATNSNQKPLDGFISSGLLVVKQVEVATAESHCPSLLKHQQQNQAPTQAGTRSVERPPTLSGRHKGVSSTHVVANKIKTKPPPHDDLTDNKLELIDGHQHGKETIDKFTVAGDGAKSLSSSDLPSDQLGDNHQHEGLGLSLTISSENNNHSTSNAMNKAISLSEISIPTTTSKDSDKGGGCKTEELDSPSAKIPGQQRKGIEVGGAGESNRFKDHEAPETMLLVGQSVGATKNFSTTANLVAPDERSMAEVLQTQSTAQTQQASSRTIITTKTEVRDVLPKANEINRIVSSASVEATDGAKVTSSATKQVNEIYSIVKHEEPTASRNLGSNGYANSSDESEKENNVNHDVSEAELINLASGNESVGHVHHLIESLAVDRKHPSLSQKASNNPSIEEDGGSSCSSSGFGASVSVTSSSESSNLADTLMNVVGSNRDREATRPNSLAVTLSRGTNHYDSVRPKVWDLQQRQQNMVSPSNAKQYPDYKQLVGPDQAYPLKGRQLLVENHNYASVVSRCDQVGCEGIVLENDDLVGGYVNLPLTKNKQNKTPPEVEYATVRSSTDSTNTNVQNKKKVNIAGSNASSSGHSYSNSSANSGGFSALPPIALEDLSDKNFNSSTDLNMDDGADTKKISLFKRFGSLVSRTFTSQTSATLATNSMKSASKIDEVSSKEQGSDYNSDGTERKSALVIVRSTHDLQAASKEKQIGEADLVILPPKNVNQRKLPDEQLFRTTPGLQQHDESLSRGKKLSRKLKRSDFSSVTSSLSETSASSSSIDDRAQHRGHPKRSESLFDDLESLVSGTDRLNSYGRLRTSRQSHRRARSSGRCRQAAEADVRIDIDCVSPERCGTSTEREHHDVLSGKSTGPRSLMRIFSAISSQRGIGSTPNLADADSKGAKCDKIISEQEVCDQSLQPISGFWGFSSLMMNNNRTNTDLTTPDLSNSSQKLRSKASAKSSNQRKDSNAHQADSLYASLQPLAEGYHLQLSPCYQQDQQHSLEKYQSLNIYQNLLRNYAKRRNRNRHGHQHSHYGHHHHHHHHHHRTRHNHRSVRCAANCALNCQPPNSCSGDSGKSHSEAVVWGQLIKINKSDGSQVIELQRSPGKSWGFFVARGAINNTKGIFISRMHDSATSSSLTGLLSIGDRILAIDECPIEPDYDILRVNQMISKKSKIMLKVKPFKG